MEQTRIAELEKLKGLANEIYKDLVERKVDFPDSEIKAKLEVFSQLKERDEQRRGPTFFLPADQYPVRMDELLAYDDETERHCDKLPQREAIVIANKPLVSPALNRYLEGTTDTLSTYCEEHVRQSVDGFKTFEREKWGLVSAFNRLASKCSVSEQATPANEALLDEAMYEHVTDILSTGEYIHDQLVEKAQYFVESTKKACLVYESRLHGNIKYVTNFKKDETREFLRYERICDQVIRRDFAETLKRIEKEIQIQ